MLRIVDSTNRRAVQALLAPERVRDAATDRRVAAIVTGVRRGGDRALLRYARKFAKLPKPSSVSNWNRSLPKYLQKRNLAILRSLSLSNSRN